MVSVVPTTLTEKIDDFLAQRRIAVAGISGTRELPGAMIYRKLKGAGYTVAALHPSLTAFEGDPCYPNLAAIPGGVEALVIATSPDLTTDLVRQALEVGVERIWMHESLIHGGTSISPEAVALCRERGVMLIAGACPMMYVQPVDFGHRCMCWMMRVTGGLPK